MSTTLTFNGYETTVTYTNWKGETRSRKIIPYELWHGSTQWHPEPQWLVSALDCEDGVRKDFALSGFAT